MPSGLIPAHYGAPRHYSLPSIYPAKPKDLVTVGHCDRLNLFYIREPQTTNYNKENLRRVALMRYRRVKPDTIEIEGMHVPPSMRGHGVSSALARETLKHMSRQNVWVDVKCPITQHYIKENQCADYVRSMVNPIALKRSKTAL